MSPARLALCLTLLVSSQGFAQGPEEWTPYTPPATQGEPPPPLVPAPPPLPPVGPPAPAPEVTPPAQAPAQPSPQAELVPRSAVPEDQTGLRLVVSPWAGAVAGMMGLVIGVVPSAIIALPFCLSSRSKPGCAISFTAGMALSYSLGVTAGVGFTGSRLGGRGDWGATFLGAAAGAALGGGLGLSTQNTGVLVLGLSIAPLVGAVLGYEASHNMALKQEAAVEQATSGFQVVPVVGATGRGGILGGLAGRF